MTIAQKFLYTTDQESAIRGLFPEFEELVKKYDPTFSTSPSEITSWKNKITETLMATPLFQDLPGPSRQEWAKNIKQKFVNHKAALKRHAGSSALKDDRCGTTKEEDNSDHSKLIRRNDILKLLQARFTAREFFVSEEAAAVHERYEVIKSERPDLRGGAAWNKAAAELWAEADHSLWERRVKELHSDVATNQTDLPKLMAHALDVLASRRNLGSVLMSFSYAYREDDDSLTTGTIIKGYNAIQDECISAHDGAMATQEVWTSEWQAHANRLLPVKPKVALVPIPSNDEGIPIFPLIDLSVATPTALITILGDYYEALWAHTLLKNPTSELSPTIPWDTMTNSPSLFIYSECSELPTGAPLAPPTSLSPSQVFVLVQFFIGDRTSATPFRFAPPRAGASRNPSPAPADRAPSEDAHSSQSVSPGDVNPLVQTPPATNSSPCSSAVAGVPPLTSPSTTAPTVAEPTSKPIDSTDACRGAFAQPSSESGSQALVSASTPNPPLSDIPKTAHPPMPLPPLSPSPPAKQCISAGPRGRKRTHEPSPSENARLGDDEQSEGIDNSRSTRCSTRNVAAATEPARKKGKRSGTGDTPKAASRKPRASNKGSYTYVPATPPEKRQKDPWALPM